MLKTEYHKNSNIGPRGLYWSFYGKPISSLVWWFMFVARDCFSFGCVNCIFVQRSKKCSHNTSALLIPNVASKAIIPERGIP